MAAAAATVVVPFVPRAAFGGLDSLPRSYFLGHHKKGLDKMKQMLATIDVVVECRDYRVPLSSQNPLLEDSLASRPRVIVYTKRDLADRNKVREDLLTTHLTPSTVIFPKQPRAVSPILSHLKSLSSTSLSLVGLRVMVAGMPNVGKSTLLNALRATGVQKGKAARIGDQPGVTRKIGQSVKIVAESEKGAGGAVYVLDTPGVFIPHVEEGETMLKLACVGCVKDGIIPPVTMADYLLYRINLVNPGLYKEYCPPTNVVGELLQAVANKTGRLQKGGTPDYDGTAMWLVQQWRTGKLGKFVLDEVSEDALQKAKVARTEQTYLKSLTQARKTEKTERKNRQKNLNS